MWVIKQIKHLQLKMDSIMRYSINNLYGFGKTNIDALKKGGYMKDNAESFVA